MGLTSSVSWLDFSDDDRRKMMEVVSLFKIRETRDELGIGSIRDAFADLLFPGTSTLQTRAGYFLFVPWLYRRYEDREVPSSKVASRLKRDEIGIIRALREAGEKSGIIGDIAGAGLQRFPGSIYWNGLRTWGILRFVGSQEQYHRSLDVFYLRRKTQQFTDDQEPISGDLLTNWDPHLPESPPRVPKKASFTLTQVEARYLRDRLLVSCPDSMLAYMVDRCSPSDGVQFAWMHPEFDGFPERLKETLDHARNFSDVMHGAALLYNLMLVELRRDEGLIAEYRGQLEIWWQAGRWRRGALSEWDREAFWNLAETGGRIPVPTRRFADGWLDLMLESLRVSSPEDNPTARALIRQRETWLKRSRSRFTSQRHREMWGGAAGTRQLDYRWPIASRLTNDILHGLGRS